MSTYKLTYFNVGYVGEPIRYLLSYCGKFEDVRLSLEEWPKHKSNMPMKQLPILEIDGKTYHQSRAIARFIAKKGNLYGSDEFEAMEIDAAIDSIEDIRQANVTLPLRDAKASTQIYFLWAFTTGNKIPLSKQNSKRLPSKNCPFISTSSRLKLRITANTSSMASCRGQISCGLHILNV